MKFLSHPRVETRISNATKNSNYAVSLVRNIGDDFFLGPNLVSFNRTVIPYEISKVNFRVETKILVSMSEEI